MAADGESIEETNDFASDIEGARPLYAVRVWPDFHAEVGSTA
jgi:hypothetical protein